MDDELGIYLGVVGCGCIIGCIVVDNMVPLGK